MKKTKENANYTDMAIIRGETSKPKNVFLNDVLNFIKNSDRRQLRVILETATELEGAR